MEREREVAEHRRNSMMMIMEKVEEAKSSPEV